MNHLIIYAHPRKESLNHAVKAVVLTELKKQSASDIRIRDLYQLDFDPVLSKEDIEGWHRGIVSPEIRAEQQHILWADNIIFIYPIWWTGLPAILKGYIDRVFSYGFAYRYDKGIQKGLLTGKEAFIINTQGKSHYEYQQSGLDQALVKTSDLGIYQYCGLDVKEHLFLEKSDRLADGSFDQWKQKITQSLTAHFGLLRQA